MVQAKENILEEPCVNCVSVEIIWVVVALLLQGLDSCNHPTMNCACFLKGGDCEAI